MVADSGTRGLWTYDPILWQTTAVCFGVQQLFWGGRLSKRAFLRLVWAMTANLLIARINSCCPFFATCESLWPRVAKVN